MPAAWVFKLTTNSHHTSKTPTYTLIEKKIFFFTFVCACGGQRAAYWSWVSSFIMCIRGIEVSSIMCIRGIEVRSSEPVASVLTHWVTWLPPYLYFKVRDNSHHIFFFLRARHNQGLANKAWWTSALPVKYILNLPPTPLAFKTEFYWPTLWPKQALNLGSFCLSLLSGWEGRPTALGMAEESHLWMLQKTE